MHRIPDHLNKANAPSFGQIFLPIDNAMINMPPLEARGNRPLKMTFEDQLKMLIFFHLEEFTSAQELLQVIEQDDFARHAIAPEEGIKKSSFAEAINCRGLEQLTHIYKNLQADAARRLPKVYVTLEIL